MVPIAPVRYPTLVLALGGNALIRPGEKGTLAEQYARIREAMTHTADLIEAGFATILIHGNGPMVGQFWSGGLVKDDPGPADIEMLCKVL